jgi:hypothetical protein
MTKKSSGEGSSSDEDDDDESEVDSEEDESASESDSEEDLSGFGNEVVVKPKVKKIPTKPVAQTPAKKTSAPRSNLDLLLDLDDGNKSLNVIMY